MFNNIGGKIKALAKVMCWIGIVMSVLSGIMTIVAGASSYDATSAIVSGVVIIIVGPLLSWIGSFFTYGFGELVENSQYLKKNY